MYVSAIVENAVREELERAWFGVTRDNVALLETRDPARRQKYLQANNLLKMSACKDTAARVAHGVKCALTTVASRDRSAFFKEQIIKEFNCSVRKASRLIIAAKEGTFLEISSNDSCLRVPSLIDC